VDQQLHTERGQPDRDEQDASALAETEDAVGQQQRNVEKSDDGYPQATTDADEPKNTGCRLRSGADEVHRAGGGHDTDEPGNGVQLNELREQSVHRIVLCPAHRVGRGRASHVGGTRRRSRRYRAQREARSHCGPRLVGGRHRARSTATSQDADAAEDIGEPKQGVMGLPGGFQLADQRGGGRQRGMSPAGEQEAAIRRGRGPR